MANLASVLDGQGLPGKGRQRGKVERMAIKVRFVRLGEALAARVKVVRFGADVEVILVESGADMLVKSVSDGEDFRVKIVRGTSS